MGLKYINQLYCKRGHFQTQNIKSYSNRCLLCIRVVGKIRYNNPEVKRYISEKSKLDYLKVKNSLIYKWKIYVSHLKRKFKLSEVQYLQMLYKTKSCCYSCNTQTNDICVDHNHKTGKIRGLLCHPCNKSLGTLKDNKQFILNLASYIQNYA